MSQQRVKVYKYCNNHIKVNRIRIYFNVCNAMIFYEEYLKDKYYVIGLDKLYLSLISEYATYQDLHSGDQIVLESYKIMMQYQLNRATGTIG